jgi:NAD(P)-dependent dehydrogenase (short-subunit alcohol dehydrogenase family)
MAETAMTVLITGANRGIGLEMARQLEARGMNVIGTARKPAEAEALKAAGARVEQLDVTDAQSIAALARTLKGVKIDMLVNNAGIAGHIAGSFEETDFAQIDQTFAVNTLGPMRVTQALLPNLEAGQHKTVIHISSRMGSIAQNSGGYYGYRASKTALNMMNSSLALELGPRGFTCVVMHPGWVKTDMGGEGADITPEESVKGLLDVFAGLTPEDNGKFYNYQGQEIPW